MAIKIDKVWVIEAADRINAVLKSKGIEKHITLDYASQYGGWQIKIEEGQRLRMPMNQRLTTREAYYYLRAILDCIDEISSR